MPGISPAALSATLLAAVLCISVDHSPAHADEILSLNATRHSAAMKEVFAELIPPVQHYLLQIEINGKTTVPGTLVDATSGYAVAKASEMGECLDKHDTFRCLTSTQHWVPATFAAYHKDLDLAILKIDFDSDTQLPAVKLASTMEAGQWVVTPAFGQKLPLGIGVLGAVPRKIESGQGYAGLTVDETSQGLQILQVMTNSGAAYAGLKKGDLILKEDETPARKRNWLSKKLNACDPGDWCALSAVRNGEILPINLRIGVAWDELIDRQAMMNRFGSDVSQRRTGFRTVFQHDTLMHPRECGGPVVNLQGELMGVNIARAGRTDTYAVPIEAITQAISDLN